MLDIIIGFFRNDYMPHGHCYLYQPGILWINIISDLIISTSYFLIPVMIILFFKRAKAIQIRKLLLLFSAFILLCGITHLFSIWVIWHGSYGWHGILKALTAIVSAITAFTLFKLMPVLNQIPSIDSFKEAQQKANKEKALRQTSELFRITTDMVPTGILVMNSQFKIQLSNPAISEIFGYSADELLDKNLSDLVGSNSKKHDSLMKSLLDSPERDQYLMAGGRTVTGVSSSGKKLQLEIGITIRKVNDEKMAFVHIQNITDSKRAERISSKLEQSAKQSIEVLEDGIWEWDIKSNGGWWNNQTAKLIGLNEEEQYDFEKWKKHIHHDERLKVIKAINQSIRNKEEFHMEYRGIGNDNVYHWLRIRGAVIYEDYKPEKMVGIITNIDNEMLIKNKLAEKTEFLEKIMQKSISGIYIFDIGSNYNTFINSAYTEITGYSLNDLAEIENFNDLFHPHDLEKVLKHIELLAIGETETQIIEYRFKHKNGSWIWCYSKDIVLQKDENNTPIFIMGSFYETTEIKKKQLEILKLASDYSNIFEQAAVGISKVGLDGSWINVNTKLCEILGYSKQELLNTNFQNITYHEDLEEDLNFVNKLIEGKEDQYQIQKRYITQDKRRIWALLTVSIVRDANDNPMHFISIIEDITHKKEMESKLEESNKSLESFAYMASHDLQEPLRKIMAFSGLLKDRLRGAIDNPDAVFELNRINNASERMSNMIKDLLNLSKYSSTDIEKKPNILNDIINRSLHDLEELIIENSAIIEINSNKTLKISADFELMSLVLRNLIKNSIKYKSKNKAPKIMIEATVESKAVCIKVIDNGIGFDNKYSEDMFMPFKRLVDKQIDGSGMGLAICKKIIDKHNGTITSSSNSIETIFTISLPID